MNTYFTKETLDKLTSREATVEDVIEELSLELRKLTDGKADIVLKTLVDGSAMITFNRKCYDENYTLVLKYTKNGDVKRNEFCAISYTASYPVLVKYLKDPYPNDDRVKVSEIKTADEFRNYLKNIVNKQPVLASIRSAMKLEDKPENFSELEVLRRVAREIINNNKVLTKNALTFLDYWTNNFKESNK